MRATMPGLPLPLSSLCLPVSLSLSLSLCLYLPGLFVPVLLSLPFCMSASSSLFCISPFLPLPGLHSRSATHGFQCVNGTHACTHLANGGMQGRRNKCVGPCEGQGWVDRAPCLCPPDREPGTQGCGGVPEPSLTPPSLLQTTPGLQLSGPDCSVQLPLHPWPAGRSLSPLPPHLDKKQICLSAACLSGRGTLLGWERRQDGLLPSSTQVGLATPEVRLPLPWGDREPWGYRSPALYWPLLRGDQGGARGIRISAQTPPLYPDMAV